MSSTSKQSKTINYDEFKNLQWQVSESGEISTDKPEYIPTIQQYLDIIAAGYPVEMMRSFIERLGEEWRNEEDHPIIRYD